MRNDNRSIINKIKPQIEKVLAEKELVLFSIALLKERSGKILRIMVDKETGPGIEDCTEASRAVSEFLDSDENIIPFDKYQLEVSTPGLERPLRFEKDFVRFLEKKCKIMTKEKDETGRKSYTGEIASVEDGKVTLYVAKESTSFVIDIKNISKANLVVEFD